MRGGPEGRLPPSGELADRCRPAAAVLPAEDVGPFAERVPPLRASWRRATAAAISAGDDRGAGADAARPACQDHSVECQIVNTRWLGLCAYHGVLERQPLAGGLLPPLSVHAGAAETRPACDIQNIISTSSYVFNSTQHRLTSLE